MSPTVLDHATSEARIAYVHYVDDARGDGKSAGEICRDFFLLGYQASLTPRTIAEIEAEARAMLLAEFGVKHANA